MIKEIECIITGRVQVVMFRDFVHKRATTLGLSGTVENLDDGSVRVVAQGDAENLKKLLGYLNKGPILAKVDNITVEWRESNDMFEDFNIIY